MCKGWIDEKTRSKVHMHGTDYKEALLKYIDIDQLHVSLGGNKKAELWKDDGPWSDYEVVDGSQKDDVVGIKRKGVDKICFSVQDYEKLPNDLVQGRNIAFLPTSMSS